MTPFLPNRRHFLRSAAAAAAFSSAAGPLILAQPKYGKRYRTVLIGTGWWGMNLLHCALEEGSCEVVALCDVDADALEISADEVDSLTGSLPPTFRDYREMLDEVKNIEIAIIATPDHWHALQAIACIEAGAHVFVEKPTGHTIGESRAMVTAARAAERIVQVGMHRRIGPHHVSGMEFLKSGKVGQIGMVRAFAHSGGGPEKATPNLPVPETLDWDLYCGPSPLRPYNKSIHPGGFRNYLDFANGILGDWGVHWLDQVLWWTEEKAPRKIYSTGGRSIKGPAILTETEQTSDAPDHQIATYEFENFTAIWEHRRFAGNGAEKAPVGCYFYGTEGTFHMGWKEGWTFYPVKGDPIQEAPRFDNEKDGHNVPPLWADFLDAIQTGRHPVADVEIGHRATSLSLLGMISLKLGRSIEWDGEKEAVLNDPEGQALLRREYRGPWVYPGA